MTQEFENFLKEIAKLIPPQKERTLFSLGGKGYYENPASDLLAFFLEPDAEHGFKGLFLETFLDCMEASSRAMSMVDVKVTRENRTEKDNRIDIVVQNSEWALLIENKIYHISNNPFSDYETYGRGLPGGKKLLLMAILSPDGKNIPGRPEWMAVSYKDYCAALRGRIAEKLFDHAYSKWMVFAREFILHFENELYRPIMNEKLADQIEQYVNQIEQAKKLAADYRVFLSKLLIDRLTNAIVNQVFSTHDEGWGIRCYADKWTASNITFLTNFSENAPKFGVRIYLHNFTPGQREKAKQMFFGMRPNEGGNFLQWETQLFSGRKDAIDELCRLGILFTELFKPSAKL